MALVSIDRAKRHLRITDDLQDVDVTMKLEMAEDIILNRLNTSTANVAITSAWDEDTLPKTVEAAIMLMLGHLWENRGDNSGGSIGGGQPDQNIWNAVEFYLRRYTTSAIA